MGEINTEKNLTEGTAQESNGDSSGRTFTQVELDAAIEKRLAREKAKYADYEDLKSKAAKLDELEDASKSELEKITEKATKLQARLDSMTKENEIRDIRDKVSNETGVPASLLSGTDEETCKTQAKAILDFKKADMYPQVKNAGDVKPNTAKNPEEAFAEWLNQNLKHH